MRAGRRERGVDRRRDQHLDDRRARPAGRARVEVRVLHVRERRRHDDAARVMRLRRAARQAREVGQLRQRDVHAERAGAAAVAGDARAKVVVQVLGRDEALEQELRIDVGDDAPRLDHVAGLELDARRAPGLHEHARDRRTRAQLDAARRALRGHRLRDRAHAADRVAPLAALAVDLAEHVMQQHVGGARRVRAREIADDRVEAERRLDRRALEPAVEQVAGALGEEIEQVAARRQRQRAKSPPGLDDVDERGDIVPRAGPQRRRRAPQHLAQHGRDAIEHRVVRGQRIGVARRELRDLGLRRRESAADLEIPAVRQRQEVGERPLAHDAGRVRARSQVADDLRVEQADRVARGGVAEPRMEFLGDRRAAEHAAALGDAHRHSGRREIRGAGEAVVAAADDDGVVRSASRRQVRTRPSRSRNRRT